MENNACTAKPDGPPVTQGCQKLTEMQQKKSSSNEYIYMDHNATTPMESEVMQTITDAMQEAWGNPSSSYAPGRNAKELIDWARKTIAQMVGGHPEDIIFTSGGTEANNLVIHTAVKYFWDHQRHLAPKDGRVDLGGIVQVLPHIITSNVEHDSVHLVVENLVKEGKAKATFLPVSKVTGCIQVDDVIAAIGPSTCLISIMLANNETGVLMPIAEICQRVKIVNHQRGKQTPKILLHTDAAQALGKLQVDVQDLGVNYLTIVGHKFYGPRIGALYVRGPSTSSPVYAMFIGGGQERKFRPGTENTPMIAGLGKTVFGKEKLHFNNHFQGSDCLPNTCNVSILGPNLQGRNILLHCQRLLASVGAACHSENVNRPSHVLLNSGIPYEVAENAIRLSVGRATSKEDVDTIVEDLSLAVKLCAAQT
ncbi:selenocysteine lyase isoform X2 [Rhinoraja longicauda]